tara:strand:- start:1896 stop:2135 length:240 start_codon:yes stop_codon:yes gene_type:complete
MTFLRNLRNLYSLEKRYRVIFNRVEILEEKYNSVLNKIEKLEEENIENTNLIYELTNTFEALDVRIDLVTAENWMNKND